MTQPNDDFVWPVRVYYEDTDSAGVVYYANYLKFLERARTEWLRSLGFEQDELKRRHNVLFAVSRLTIEYLKPARFNDMLSVGVRMQRRGSVSLTLGQAVRRGPDAVLCRSEVRIACVAADTLRPCAIPTFVVSELKRDH
ncbi:MAG: tol-pal system-associated acyl-CoA thioesterase [Gammaproteobacteria bacterium]|nr:tol-pal system-associated acyl-CoA thioesterase [Gammaproteobacteria bacterium]